MLSTFFFLLVLTAAHAQQLITPETEAYIESLITRWNSTGLAIAVVRQDNTSQTGWHHEFGSYGISNAHGDPVTPDTVFSIASNSKLFLAYSVGLLIENSTLSAERGKELKWTTKAKDVLGGVWGLMDEYMDRATNIQDMLSHRTGMPRHDFSGTTGERNIAEMISRLRYLRPSAELRETFQYNNLMYETLSYLPELLLGQAFESYVEDNLFRPLNMSSSTYSVKVAEASGMFADGFQWHLRDITRNMNGTLRATVPYFFRPGEEGTFAGAGGVLSSARDLAMWVSMLLNEGKHPYTNKTIVPSSVVEHAATGVTVYEGKASYPELSPNVYGAGQWRYTYRGRELVEHGGTTPGFRTQIMRFPNDNLAIVALSNDAQGNWLMESAKWRIVDDVLFPDQKKLDWNFRYEELWSNYVTESQQLTPRPDSPVPPTKSLEHLAEGTFHHPAYDTLRPCLVPSSFSPLNSPNKYSEHIQQHEFCEYFLESLPARRILSNTNLSTPTLLIPWKRAAATHLRLQHFSGNLFNVTTIWSNAEVRRYGFRAVDTSNPKTPVIQTDEQEPLLSPFESVHEDDGDMLTGLDEHYEVEWVIPSGSNREHEEGLAFKGGFWGMEGPVASSPRGEGKESAEVWFGKV